MKAEVVVVLGALLVGAGASAQESQPTVVPFPLELKSAPAGAERDQADLQSTWRRLLRVAALVPDTGTVDEALKDSGRRDCEREDECLKALALKAKTLYAAYANVGLDLTRTKVVATGRVVRDDGQLVAGIRTVTVELGAGTFGVGAKAALEKLVDELGVKGLSPVRPAETPRVAGDVPPAPPIVIGPVDRPMSGGKVGGAVMIAGGAAVAVTGLVLAISAAADSDTLKIDANGNITGTGSTADLSAQAKSLGTRRALGGVFIGVGVAAAIAGVLVFAMTGDSGQVAVGATPLPGGFAASVGGSF